MNVIILFLSFRRVLNANYSFLGNSPASELKNKIDTPLWGGNY